MAAYADFTYYSNTFLGTAIAETDFPRLALRASGVLDQLTFGRVAPIVTAATDTETIDKIKMATCEVAEELQREDSAGGADGLQSESQGQYSVSYGSNSSRSKTNKTKQNEAANLWLANTGLLFKGF